MFLPRRVLCGRLRQWMGGCSHMTCRIIVCGTLPPVRRLMNRLYRWVLHGIAWDGMSLFLMMRAYKALLGSLIPLVGLHPAPQHKRDQRTQQSLVCSHHEKQ